MRQMQKARLKVNAYLQGLDDKSLASLGYTPARHRQHPRPRRERLTNVLMRRRS